VTLADIGCPVYTDFWFIQGSEMKT